MWGLTAGEWTLTAIIVALVFGWSAVPRLGERIGRALGAKRRP